MWWLIPEAMQLLATRPAVLDLGGRVRIWTPMLTRVLTLFAFSRDVTLDRERRLIDLRVRRFWFFTTRRLIPFDRIEHIDIGFTEVGAQSEDSTDGEWQRYSVGLRVSDRPDPVHLFSTLGQRLDESYWDRLSGADDQRYLAKNPHIASFHQLVDLLREATGATLGPRVEALPGVTAEGWRCARCGRPALRSRADCAYCGGELTPADGPAGKSANGRKRH